MHPQDVSSPENEAPSSSAYDEEEIYHPLMSNSEKRRIDRLSEDSSPSVIVQGEHDLPSSMAARSTKRIKLGRRKTQLDPVHLVLHKVECGRSINHNHHPETSYFLDAPRLFAGDNKASPLRGTSSIANAEEYLEDNEHISIVIYRTYDCEEYHERVEQSFERLRLSDFGVRTVAAMRPYLFVVSKDMAPATSVSEYMTLLSHDLKEALRNLEMLNPSINYNSFRQNHWRLNAPYLQMYHFRDLVRQTIPRLSSAEERKHADVLLTYIDEAFGDDYAEADNMFAKGMVSQNHLSKLFGPDETVVTMKESQPVAFISRGLPNTGHPALTLQCENWNFDGVFGQTETGFNVVWPSTSPEILPIVELEIFPLKYDHSGIQKRLLARGQVLWNCRKRRYMTYTALTGKSEIHTVSIYIIHNIYACIDTNWNRYPRDT